MRAETAAIRVVTPAPPGSRQGNRTTALRWRRLLRELGHRVAVGERWDGERCDLLIALHALRSHDALRRFRARHPDRPAVLALTGTDLYRDLARSRRARASLALADRLVVLHELAPRALPARLRRRTRVIHQSVRPLRAPVRRAQRTFDVAVLAHLRAVKDPLCAARAARRLPPDSRVRVVLVGGIAQTGILASVQAERARNPRLHWLGERPRWQALRALQRARLAVNSSRLEGGANAVGEAIALGVPVLATRVDGNVGLLGAGYPGLFPVGDAAALAELLHRCERDASFLAELGRRCASRAPRFAPERERRAWRELLAELLPGHRGRRGR